MKGLLSGLIALSVCISCHKPGDLSGRYVNSAEPEAEHYVDLKADSSYVHYYKGPLGEKQHTGTWLYHPDSKEVSFRDWVGFGQYTDLTCKDTCIIWAPFDAGTIYFYPDGNEMNFSRNPLNL